MKSLLCRKQIPQKNQLQQSNKVDLLRYLTILHLFKPINRFGFTHALSIVTSNVVYFPLNVLSKSLTIQSLLQMLNTFTNDENRCLQVQFNVSTLCVIKANSIKTETASNLNTEKLVTFKYCVCLSMENYISEPTISIHCHNTSYQLTLTCKTSLQCSQLP